MANDFTREDNFLKVTYGNNEPEYYSNPNGKFKFNEQRTHLVIIVRSAEEVRFETSLADITFEGVAPDDADDAIDKLKLLFPDTNSGSGGSGDASNAWKAPVSVALTGVGGVAGNTTTYAQINGRAASFGTEINTQFIITEDCTIENLFAETSNTQDGTGDLVITLRVNGVSKALTVTIAADAAAGEFSDTTHSVDVVAGDLICWELANGASASSATIISIGATLSGTAEGGSPLSIGGTYDNNDDAVAALGIGELYQSSTLINGSPIILRTATGGTYDNNADAVAALGVGKLYNSSTQINESPIILITV
jgi:hypothetical protein